MISFENFVTRSKLKISAYLAANKITSDDALRDYCLANNIVPPSRVYFPEKKENKVENESSNNAAKTKPKVKKPRVAKPQASSKALTEEKTSVKNASPKRKSRTTRKRTSRTTKTQKK